MTETSTRPPLVSIVTPLYNDAEYLVECIESVLAQSYSNWDYTIIDNQSDDGSLEIAARYAQQDSRIRVVRNETHVRVIPNHNVAFRQVSPASKYCKVVLADDWLFPDCLEKMVQVAEDHPSVGIVACYGLKGWEPVWYGLPYPSTIVPGRTICRSQLLCPLGDFPDDGSGRYVMGTPTSQLFRSEILRSREAFYNEDNVHADAEACYEVLRQWDLGFVHQILCFHRPADATSMSAMSARLNTLMPRILHELVTFGPVFLTTDELTACIQEHFRRYYKFLGKRLLEGSDKSFWTFHAAKCKAYGYPLRYRRVVQAAVSLALDAGLSLNSWPYKALKRVFSVRHRPRVNRAHTSSPAPDPHGISGI